MLTTYIHVCDKISIILDRKQQNKQKKFTIIYTYIYRERDR